MKFYRLTRTPSIYNYLYITVTILSCIVRNAFHQSTLMSSLETVFDIVCRWLDRVLSLQFLGSNAASSDSHSTNILRCPKRSPRIYSLLIALLLSCHRSTALLSSLYCSLVIAQHCLRLGLPLARSSLLSAICR